MWIIPNKSTPLLSSPLDLWPNLLYRVDAGSGSYGRILKSAWAGGEGGCFLGAGPGGWLGTSWEAGPTPSQTPLPGPAQPRFSKCVYFKAVGVLELHTLTLFRVPQTLAMDFSIHGGCDTWPSFICGTAGCKSQGLSAIWKEERSLSHTIRDKVRITFSSKACTGSLQTVLFQTAFFLEGAFLLSFIRSI